MTNGLHSAAQKIPKSSNNLGSSAPEPDLNSPAALKENHKKKKKKKRKRKRRHSEVQGDSEPVTPQAAMTTLVESASEHKQKKKKKKRKREDNESEAAKERECVLSHLDASNPDEDWCQAGIWSLTSHPDTEQREQKPQSATATPARCESTQNKQGGDSVKSKKKRKKKKKKIQETEAVQDTTCSASEMWVELFPLNVSLLLFSYFT